MLCIFERCPLIRYSHPILDSKNVIESSCLSSNTGGCSLHWCMIAGLSCRMCLFSVILSYSYESCSFCILYVGTCLEMVTV